MDWGNREQWDDDNWRPQTRLPHPGSSRHSALEACLMGFFKDNPKSRGFLDHSQVYKNLWVVQITMRLKTEHILRATYLQSLHYVLILTPLANLILPTLCSSLLHAPCTPPTPSLCPCYTSHLCSPWEPPEKVHPRLPSPFQTVFPSHSSTGCSALPLNSMGNFHFGI